MQPKLDRWITSTKRLRPKRKSRVAPKKVKVPEARVPVSKIRFEELPCEVLALVCRQCKHCDLENLSLVCKKLRQPAQAQLLLCLSILLDVDRPLDEIFTVCEQLLATLGAAHVIRKLHLIFYASNAKAESLEHTLLALVLKTFLTSPKLMLSEIELSIPRPTWYSCIEPYLLNLPIKPSKLFLSNCPSRALAPSQLSDLLCNWSCKVLSLGIFGLGSPEEPSASYLSHLHAESEHSLKILELRGDDVSWQRWLTPSLLASLASLTFESCSAPGIKTLLVAAAREAQQHVLVERLTVTGCDDCDREESSWEITEIMRTCPQLRCVDFWLSFLNLDQEDFQFDEVPATVQTMTLRLEPATFGLYNLLRDLVRTLGEPRNLPDLSSLFVHTRWASHWVEFREITSYDPDNIEEKHLAESFEYAKAARGSARYPGDPRSYGMTDDDYVWWMDEKDIKAAALDLEVDAYIKDCNDTAREAKSGFEKRGIKHNLILPLPMET